MPGLFLPSSYLSALKPWFPYVSSLIFPSLSSTSVSVMGALDHMAKQARSLPIVPPAEPWDLDLADLVCCMHFLAAVYCLGTTESLMFPDKFFDCC